MRTEKFTNDYASTNQTSEYCMNGDVLFGLGFVLIIVLVIGAVAAPVTGVGTPRGESQYTGHVVDVVEDKGIVMKPSWVNMKTNPRSSDVQQYCVLPGDEQLIGEFYGAMEQGDRMTITYSRPLWVNPFDCKSDQAVIRDLRPANTTQEATA